MSGFPSEWLALREPVDLAARNGNVETAFFAALPDKKVKLLDLASGKGSTVAALSGKLGRAQEWILTDNDPVLLNAARARYADFGEGNVTCRQFDLSAELQALPFDQVDAVTTSAFLDLVTRPFLEDLVSLIVEARVPFLASLTYDGRAVCVPADPLDEEIRLAMNTHQKTDKGFGPALGPEAADIAISLFQSKGYRVVSGPSDWHSGPGTAAFQTELVTGWISAAREMGVDREQLARWSGIRADQIAQGILSLTVGHLDFAALPA